jgi:uncharacterized membrane protein YdfJ with MMPL/SSD domain
MFFVRVAFATLILWSAFCVSIMLAARTLPVQVYDHGTRVVTSVLWFE